LVGRCSNYITSAGDVHPFDADMRATIEGVKNMYSSQGKRCILFARKTIRRADIVNQAGTTQFEDEMATQAKTGLTLVGLVAIVDPLRPEIKSVVSTLRGAGIRFFMVSTIPLESSFPAY
jgi:sodium/potassium-transporting ATPase subunit alpha